MNLKRPTMSDGKNAPTTPARTPLPASPALPKEPILPPPPPLQEFKKGTAPGDFTKRG